MTELDPKKLKYVLFPADNGWIIYVYTLLDEFRGSVIAENIDAALSAIKEVVGDESIEPPFEEN